MSKEISNPWNYDVALRFARNLFHKTRKSVKDVSEYTQKELRQIDRALGSYRDYAEGLSKARPFLIGPSTLDLLVDVEPLYEDLNQHRLPHNRMFFELPKYLEIALGDFSHIGNLIGIDMQTMWQGKGEIPEGSIGWYHIWSYFKSDNKISVIRYVTKLTDPQEFRGELLLDGSARGLRSDNDGNLRMSKPYDDPMEYIIDRLKCAENLERFYDTSYDRDSEFVQGLRQIAGTCTNIVSCLNGVNIKIVESEREIRKSKKGRKGKRKITSDKQPFSLVVIYDEPDMVSYSKRSVKPESEIDYRYCTKGHRQRYHTKQGVVIHWKKPNVCGPKKAPFIDQRHALIARHIQEERAMIKEYSH